MQVVYSFCKEFADVLHSVHSAWLYSVQQTLPSHRPVLRLAFKTTTADAEHDFSQDTSLIGQTKN